MRANARATPRTPGQFYETLQMNLRPTHRAMPRFALKPPKTIKSVVTQAQRGNPKAIEVLARQSLGRSPEGREVRVRVARRNATLLVHLTAPTAPRRESTMAWAKSFFETLPVVGVSGAQILSHRAGIPEPVWSDRIPVRRLAQGVRLTPALAGKAFAGIVVLTLLWSVGSMVRGSMVRRAASKLVPQPNPSQVAQSPSAQATTTKPTHKIIREKIFDGQYIEIDTGDPNLSRDECVAIAAKYLDEAGTDGQVVVKKPNPKPPWSGKPAPFCADNNDGEGTFFNDEYF